jgi:glycosyltransferase involved in cell wall biosynthesis
MHIGIFADYGISLTPQCGIGVVVYNLMQGLARLEPRPRITLRIHPGDEEKIQQILRAWRLHHVELYPLGAKAEHYRRRAERARGRSMAIHSIRRAIDRVHNGWPRVGGKLLTRWLALALDRWLIQGPLTALDLPLRTLGRVADAEQERYTEREVQAREAPEPTPDVWLIPHGGTRWEMNAPEVLMIFDLVYRHVEGVLSDHERECFENALHYRVERAGRIYCGLQAVFEQDLKEVIPEVIEKVRVVSLAPPAVKQQRATKTRQRLCRAYGIGERFLFYPAGFRIHKNHRRLLEACQELYKHANARSLQLVCTGEGEVARQLREEVTQRGLAGCVHFLGLVPQEDVAAFYQHAELVVLPSLHEGYGLPLLEALRSGAVITCSHIPAFRELLDGYHDSVRFFDPYQPTSICQAILDTLGRKKELLASQQATYRALKQRNWKEVARDFIQLFCEARETSAYRSGHHFAFQRRDQQELLPIHTPR